MPGRVLLVAAVASILVVSVVAAAWAADGDEFRGYLHLKFRDTDNATGVHDFYGFGLGANLTRYLGLELSGDRFEIFPKVSGLGTIGEYGVFTLMPQLRVRYPIWRDRVVPYVLGGVGVALTDFNDRKPRGFGVAVRHESSALVGTLGAGIDVFVADNVALNAEFKYLFAEGQTLRVGGTRHDLDLSSPLASVGFRVFLPESRRELAAADLPEPAPLRVYFNGRLGVARPPSRNIGSGIETPPVPPAIGGELAQYFGVGFGLDLGRHLGIELGAEGYEVALKARDIGTVGEYAVYTLMPRLRVRYPVGGGRWVPYALVGVGLGHAEFNDRKPHGAGLRIEANTNSVAAAAGVGLDYFVARNLAFGIESKFLRSPGHTITIGSGHRADATLDALVVSFGVRIYLWDMASAR
jgi:opacity protein-like surface antigen